MASTVTQISSHFSMSGKEEGELVSAIYFGMVIGSLIGGALSDVLGRWKSCLLQTAIFAVGSVLLGSAQYMEVAIIGRSLVGVAAALSAVSAVPYLKEITPIRYAGRVAALFELNVAVGIFLANIIGLTQVDVPNSWRHVYFLPTIFAVVQVCL
jgi:MFS family permease